MPQITLPDGSVRSYDAPVTAATIASDIGPGLAKAALIAVVDGDEWDLSRPIEADATVALVTAKDDAALALLRHDCAHVMAEAVLELFFRHGVATVFDDDGLAVELANVRQGLRKNLSLHRRRDMREFGVEASRVGGSSNRSVHVGDIRD